MRKNDIDSQTDDESDSSRYAIASSGTLLAGTRSYVVVIALAVVVALVIAPFAWQFGAESAGTIAVIQIAGDIDGENAADVIERLEQARSNSAIEGVVIVVNSPGGLAAPSEELFMAIDRVAEQMPVVATVGAAATSGAYYAISPADKIYVTPSSAVGSIGVFAVPPDDVAPIDGVIQSGPDKLSGDTERGWIHNVDAVNNAFIESVFEHRGEVIELDRSDVERATVYNGLDAVDVGLADEIGDTQDGIHHVAEETGFDSYEISHMQYDTPVQFVSQATYESADVPDKSLVDPGHYIDRNGDQSIPLILMFPLDIATESDEIANEPADGSETTSETEGDFQRTNKSDDTSTEDEESPKPQTELENPVTEDGKTASGSQQSGVTDGDVNEPDERRDDDGDDDA